MKAADHIKTPEQYLESLPPERQQPLRLLHDAIRATAPELEPHIQSGMLGYGPYPYRTKSGCEGVWFVVGLASQKQYISLYLCACDGDGYLAENNAHRLGKVSCGRSCVRLKKLEHLNMDVALELVRESSRQAQEKGVITM